MDSVLIRRRLAACLQRPPLRQGSVSSHAISLLPSIGPMASPEQVMVIFGSEEYQSNVRRCATLQLSESFREIAQCEIGKT